ncbi:hypothetical protein Tco_0696797 [Tanacetum coccineum]
MHTDELYKFSEGTLTSVRSVLHDIASNLRMDYLPKRRWSSLDRKRSCIMIKAIDMHLLERRLMRNFEKFVDLILQAGNPVKEIILKLNPPDYRSILTDSKIHIKMDMEVPGSSRLKDS